MEEITNETAVCHDQSNTHIIIWQKKLFLRIECHLPKALLPKYLLLYSYCIIVLFVQIYHKIYNAVLNALFKYYSAL